MIADIAPAARMRCVYIVKNRYAMIRLTPCVQSVHVGRQTATARLLSSIMSICHDTDRMSSPTARMRSRHGAFEPIRRGGERPRRPPAAGTLAFTARE
ncbi:MAG TPA: hypothetical protein PKZ76_10130 [Xanthomonadaceae bacterium]|nr:hypothetical protein [Xanthomonadaceae bacterium]